MEQKITREERHWILYDVGNSAYTMLVTTIIPIYFNYIAGNQGVNSVDYLAYWAYAASVVTLIVAILGPIVGTFTDNKGFKKPIFIVSLAIGSVCCVALGFTGHWLLFLIMFIISKIGYSSSLIFYDSMLPDVTTPERMDKISTSGYAWGYIGSCIPFIVCIGIVLKGGDLFGISMETAMMISFVITALWWVGMTLPLLRTYKQKYYVECEKHAVAETFKRLGHTLANARKHSKIFWFLIAFFFYIDGVYTVIDMATSYGQALGLESSGLLLALLVTQLVAFPCAIIFGKLAQKFEAQKLITVCIFAYIGIVVFAIFLTNIVEFWILAVMVGMFQGGIQALSRSYFTKIIPPEQSGEFFGIYDICGKGAAFLGTTLVGLVSQMTGSINKGISVLSLLFVLGLIFFRIAAASAKKDQG
ncbi:MAG: MFS transporter [Lachnospiraceae bacterium]|nr:MFS transporter [Lachnospiraceae bacterium]MBP5282506.1 MFS transporter [Lachnospiraceae bacterium]